MEGPDIFRLATAQDVEKHLGLIQPGTWRPLFFARVVWVPGVEAARTIASGVERALTVAGSALGQHWYRAGLDVLDGAIRSTAQSLRAPCWTHQELIARLRRQENEEADRFAAGVF